MKVVFVELDRCIACLSCEHVCRFEHSRLRKGGAANIFVKVDMDRRRIYTGTCLQCKPAWCMQVCPVEALSHDPVTSAVIVDKQQCIGCGMCVVACPFGYMQLDVTMRRAAKCDLCGGNPKCVQVCMAGALHFDTIDALAARRHEPGGRRLGIRAVPSDCVNRNRDKADHGRRAD